MRVALLSTALAITLGGLVSAETLEGRWKLVAAEDLGTIVVQGGSCYVQIMSSDVPDFSAGSSSAGPASPGDRMAASLLSSYIAYTGPCTFDDAAGTTTMKVVAAWRPDYVGTSQTRFYRFEGNKLLYGPARNSIRSGSERLTRRLTLERP
jgi:hypothetical protein